MRPHWTDNIDPEKLFPDEEKKRRMREFGCENWLEDIEEIHHAYIKWKRRAIIKVVLLYIIVISLYAYICYLILC